MEYFDVGLVGEFFFEFGDEAIVQFDGGDFLGGLGQFVGEDAVSWSYFDDLVFCRKIGRLYDFVQRPFVGEEVLTERFFSFHEGGRFLLVSKDHFSRSRSLWLLLGR